jgi:predicted 3-demethylubiquinone-9 3-methyltransferase (glyoxalase superfamily)
MQKITPFLWYSKQAEEAAAFYASIFPDSRVTRVTALPSASPSGPPGSVKIVEFVLFGQSFTAMSAGPLDAFNHSVSFVVNCEDQAELDRYWQALLDGGSAEQVSLNPERIMSCDSTTARLQDRGTRACGKSFAAWLCWGF